MCYFPPMQKCDRSKSGTLAGEEIKHFYDLLTQRDEIDVIYGEYAKTTGFMSAQNLVDFLLKEQREKATLADAHRIIETYEPDENGQYTALFQVFSRPQLCWFSSCKNQWAVSREWSNCIWLPGLKTTVFKLVVSSCVLFCVLFLWNCSLWQPESKAPTHCDLLLIL